MAPEGTETCSSEPSQVQQKGRRYVQLSVRAGRNYSPKHSSGRGQGCIDKWKQRQYQYDHPQVFKRVSEATRDATVVGLDVRYIMEIEACLDESEFHGRGSEKTNTFRSRGGGRLI